MDYAHSHPDPPYVAAPPRARRFLPAPPPPEPRRLPTDEAWALVAPFRERLVAVARERGLSLPDAQDVAHHVLCRSVERGCVDPDRVEAQLVRAVVARCADVAEDEVRQERLLARTRCDDRLVGSLDETVCDRAQAHWLLGRLPERERAVILLSVAGETVTGIAAATGLSYPTVDRLLSRARKEMRRLAGTLGLVGAVVWRQRRLAAAPAATVAVAFAGITMLSPPSETATRPAPAPPPAASDAVTVRPPRAARPVAVPPRRIRVTPVAAAAPAAAAEQATTPGTRPPVANLTVGRVVEHGDEKDLVERVEQCLREGVAVELGSRGGVVCAGDEVTPVVGQGGV